MAIKGDGIGQHQHHQDRDQPAEAGADREKQHPGADSGAKQARGSGVVSDLRRGRKACLAGCNALSRTHILSSLMY